MEKLTALINNFNTNCHKKYTNVSSYLGNRLDESLKEIERFYYSNFWENRLKRRLSEEGLVFNPIELDVLLGITSLLREDVKFKLFDENQTENGISDNKTMIALNINMNDSKLNDSHINNVIMHEFGHLQYNQIGFQSIVQLNKEIISLPNLYIKNNTVLLNNDIDYFTDDNEIRQRIIPIIKEMKDNNWTSDETYELSANLENDDIKTIFDKNYILYLIENLL